MPHGITLCYLPPDISDCELVEARHLVEELECSYLSDVELVSAIHNVEDSLKVSGHSERPFLQHISACELKDLIDSRFAKKTVDQAVWAVTVFDFDDCI